MPHGGLLGFPAKALQGIEGRLAGQDRTLPWHLSGIVTVRLDKRESSTRVRILPQDNVVRVDLALAEAEVPAPGS